MCEVRKDNTELMGYRALLGSALAFSLMTACVKNLGGRIPVAELIFARSIFSLTLTRIMLHKKRINPWGKNKGLLIIRGICGTSALYFIFKALTIMTLASATIIQYTYPTFTAIFAYFILREDLNKQIFLSILIGWLGIILIVQPYWLFNNLQVLSNEGLIVALSGAILTSLAYICVRKLSKTEHPLVIIHYFPLISIPATLPFVCSNFIMPNGIDWVLIIGIGWFTQLGQVWITDGLRLIPAARACSINYSQVIFASLWGIIIFNEKLNYMVAFGAICVLLSTLITVSSTQKTLKSSRIRA